MASVDIRGAPMGPAGALGPAVAADGDGMQALRDELARERREHDRMASKLDSLRQARAELQSMTAFCHGEVGRLQSTVALLKLHPTAGPAADSATDTKPVAPAAVTTGATGTVELDAVYRSAVAQADQLAGLKQGRRLDQLADALRTRRSLASNLVASTRVASAVATDRPAVVLARCPALLRWRNELAAETGQHGAASMHDPSFGSADERSGSILPGDSVRLSGLGCTAPSAGHRSPQVFCVRVHVTQQSQPYRLFSSKSLNRTLCRNRPRPWHSLAFFSRLP